MQAKKLIDLIRVFFGFKNTGCLDHAEHLQQGRSAECGTVKTPRTILTNTAIVDIPVTARILKRTGDEYAFNEPSVVYHNGFVEKRFTITHLFQGNLRITANSRDGLIHCESAVT